MDTVRVLLVDDDPDYPVLLRDLLSDIVDCKYEIDWASSYRTACEHIRRNTYDAYLVDYRLGEHTGLDLLRNELERGRLGPVIVLTGQATRELDLEAMQAGAADFLIKGAFRAADLERCIRYAIVRHQEKSAPAKATGGPSSRRMVCFLGAKGGVGTTTVAVNVAAALARSGKPTLALDLHPGFGTLALHLKASVRQDLGDLMRHAPEEINEVSMRHAVTSHAGGLDLVAAPQHAHKYRTITPEAARAIVDTAYHMSAFSVVDLPSDGSLANREAMWRSAFVGLVVEREPASLVAAERMLELLGSWGIRKAVGLVIVDRGSGYTLPVSAVAQKLERQVYGIVPPAREALEEAAHRPAPLVTANPNHEAARAMAALADRLAGDVLRPIAV
ncbi:MAG TPA: response regulator [Candidatus Limnocylindrales bacterium]|nr:response regulator [Candidatus Limnocylindrales bacterium]